MAEQHRWISVIEDVVQTCQGSQESYRYAAEHSEDADLRSFFIDQAQERGLFAHELQEQLDRLGRGGRRPQVVVSKTPHDVFAELKKAAGGDQSILEALEAGEARVRETYERALQRGLPDSFQAALRGQLQSIIAAQDHIKLVLERRKAA